MLCARDVETRPNARLSGGFLDDGSDAHSSSRTAIVRKRFGPAFRNAMEINGTVFARTFDQVIVAARFTQSCWDRQRRLAKGLDVQLTLSWMVGWGL